MSKDETRNDKKNYESKKEKGIQKDGFEYPIILKKLIRSSPKENCLQK